jgi:hypothetical protein
VVAFRGQRDGPAAVQRREEPARIARPGQGRARHREGHLGGLDVLPDRGVGVEEVDGRLGGGRVVARRGAELHGLGEAVDARVCLVGGGEPEPAGAQEDLRQDGRVADVAGAAGELGAELEPLPPLAEVTERLEARPALAQLLDPRSERGRGRCRAHRGERGAVAARVEIAGAPRRLRRPLEAARVHLTEGGDERVEVAPRPRKARHAQIEKGRRLLMADVGGLARLPVGARPCREAAAQQGVDPREGVRGVEAPGRSEGLLDGGGARAVPQGGHEGLTPGARRRLG